MPVVALALLAFLILGCHAAIGPQIGYTFDRGVSYGWEMGGGWAYIRGNTGQVYRPSKSEAAVNGLETVAYLVAEPWYYVGGTLGVAGGQYDGVGFAGGLWEGAAIPIGSGDDSVPIVSLAAGVRYLNGAVEIYATPKFGIAQAIRFDFSTSEE